MDITLIDKRIKDLALDKERVNKAYLDFQSIDEKEYRKRLKENDKKLFVFKSEKFQTDKRGNTTNTRYDYPKICQEAKGLV